MIQKALKESFGIDCLINEIQVKDLPVFMKSGRKLYKLLYGAYAFLLVELSTADKFGTIALRKQAAQYKENTGLDVIYVFKSVSKTQRDALVSNGISFVCLPNQIFLPVMGVALKNHFKKTKELDVEKMMPATQSLFLYLLYEKKDLIMKSEAAKDLRLTKTSITRASEQLKAMKLITEENAGKIVYMKPISSGRDFFELAKPYLINPIQKSVFVSESKYTNGLYEAGESALSHHSMLAEPKVKSMAIYKGDSTIDQFIIVDPQWSSDSIYCRIELWKYNPGLFSIGNSVDIVSLAMSLLGNGDERVQGELEEYMESYKW